MTNDEFRLWFSRHCSAFTGLASWFAKLPDQPREGSFESSKVGLMRSWYGVLAGTDLADALEATGVMFRDDTDVMFDRHPATIRRIAQQLSAPRRMADRAKSWQTRDERFRCAECLDSGFRTVVHPKTVRDWLEGKATGVMFRCCVACTCAAGAERFPDTPQRIGDPKRYPLYNAATMCLAEIRTDDGWRTATGAEMRELLAGWLDGYQQRRIESQYADNWQPANGATYESVCQGEEF